MNGAQTDTLEFFRGKQILVTGGAGYLAGALIALLQQTDCRVLRLLRQASADGPQERGAAEVIDLIGDIRDPQLWERCLDGTELIFHLAAQTSTYLANADPPADQAINVLPLLYLLEACRRRGSRPTLCLASTVTIAGLPQRLPVDETHPDHPLTVYDLHKQMAEQYLRWYAEQGAVYGVSLRLANVYGPGPRSSRADRGILNQMVRRALAGETLTVYGAGDQLRDYLYVEDAARAFLAAARYGETLNGKAYVIGSGEGRTIAEAMAAVAERCALRTGRRAALEHIDPPADLSPIEQRHFVADTGRFSRATGWTPLIPFVEGIDRTLEALL